IVNAHAGQIAGTVYVRGSSIEIETGNNTTLTFNTVNSTGGPVVLAAHNTITLTNSVATNGGALTIVSTDNIFDGDPSFTIDTTGSGDAGNLIMVAGANYSDSGTDFTIIGRSGHGGSIDLPDTTAITTVGHGTGAGGNMNFIAYASDVFGTSGGYISIPTTT